MPSGASVGSSGYGSGWPEPRSLRTRGLGRHLTAGDRTIESRVELQRHQVQVPQCRRCEQSDGSEVHTTVLQRQRRQRSFTVAEDREILRRHPGAFPQHVQRSLGRVDLVGVAERICGIEAGHAGAAAAELVVPQRGDAAFGEDISGIGQCVRGNAVLIAVPVGRPAAGEQQCGAANLTDGRAEASVVRHISRGELHLGIEGSVGRPRNVDRRGLRSGSGSPDQQQRGGQRGNYSSRQQHGRMVTAFLVWFRVASGAVS